MFGSTLALAAIDAAVRRDFPFCTSKVKCTECDKIIRDRFADWLNARKWDENILLRQQRITRLAREALLNAPRAWQRTY